MGKIFGKRVYESVEPGSQIPEEDVKSGPDILTIGIAILCVSAAGLFAYNTFITPKAEPVVHMTKLDDKPELRGLSQ